MFPVFLISLLMTLLSGMILFIGVWEHETVVIKLAVLALVGWLVALGVSIYAEFGDK